MVLNVRCTKIHNYISTINTKRQESTSLFCHCEITFIYAISKIREKQPNISDNLLKHRLSMMAVQLNARIAVAFSVLFIYHTARIRLNVGTISVYTALTPQ